MEDFVLALEARQRCQRLRRPHGKTTIDAHFSHSDWLWRLRDARCVGVFAAALSSCGLSHLSVKSRAKCARFDTNQFMTSSRCPRDQSRYIPSLAQAGIHSVDGTTRCCRLYKAMAEPCRDRFSLLVSTTPRWGDAAAASSAQHRARRFPMANGRQRSPHPIHWAGKLGAGRFWRPRVATRLAPTNPAEAGRAAASHRPINSPRSWFRLRRFGRD